MIEGGRRRRNQPAPPHIIFDALTDPDHDPARPWLILEDDEQRPRILSADPPRMLVWSSLWPSRPDAQIRFDLPYDAARAGTDLTWMLLLNEPRPDDSKLGYFRKRINTLINGNLRYSFGN
ncbi:hypothetical protein SAMN04515671_1772 [Nakamurella panacisegetis]|uniref:Uncharacterized protein n=1 Tax=Nakamurella panacisegetis TaxID=1090615 RepID=A0A1H0LRF7_9ACTN|nr:hypothetical protein [Nakamurella panacisegetis]SDO70778.1 hypothetical protein SAMN04515671_1772 [Nakamurella panacisegetis]